MLTELSLAVFLDQEGGGRHLAERVPNVEVSYVRYLIGWSAKKFDYINRVVKRFRLRSTRVLIRLQRIYNFLLFHAIIYSVLDV